MMAYVQVEPKRKLSFSGTSEEYEQIYFRSAFELIFTWVRVGLFLWRGDLRVDRWPDTDFRMSHVGSVRLETIEISSQCAQRPTLSYLVIVVGGSTDNN